MNIDDWRSQLKRGTLEFCILLMIQKGECYGYELISSLEGWPILSAKESTIYPLLRRLLKEGLLASYWRDSAEGLPPRKYYALTDKGRDCLSAMRSSGQRPQTWVHSSQHEAPRHTSDEASSALLLT